VRFTDPSGEQASPNIILEAANGLSGNGSIWKPDSNDNVVRPDIKEERTHQEVNHPDPINEGHPNGFGMKNISERGKDFIRSWEQGPSGKGEPALKVYDTHNPKVEVPWSDVSFNKQGKPLDKQGSVDLSKDWTIGYGHKIPAGEDFSKGLTKQEAIELLNKDIKTKAVDLINKNVSWPLNQDRFDALTSYVFATGGLYKRDASGKSVKTELLKKLNKGDYEGAVKEMNINTQNKHVLKGLENRRIDEHKMWNSGIYINH
jgi:GH24 family phage-related lysozyme (muramidase)